MSTTTTGSDNKPKSKLVELFGVKSQTLPNPGDEGPARLHEAKMKASRTRTFDHIGSPDAHAQSRQTPTGQAKQTALPKQRNPTNPKPPAKKVEAQKSRSSQLQQLQQLQQQQQQPHQQQKQQHQQSEEFAARFDRKSPGENRKQSVRREERQTTSAVAKTIGGQRTTSAATKSTPTSQRQPDVENEETEEDDDGDHPSLLRNRKSARDRAEVADKWKEERPVTGPSGIQVKPMSPINRYSVGQAGSNATSLLSRISQRYIIPDQVQSAIFESGKSPRHQHQPPASQQQHHHHHQQQHHHHHQQQQQHQQQRGPPGRPQLPIGSMASSRMNKSLDEALKYHVTNDDDDDGDDGDVDVYSSSESLSTTNSANASTVNFPVKPSSEGALFAFNPHHPRPSDPTPQYPSLSPSSSSSLSSTMTRARSATNPQPDTLGISLEETGSESTQFGYGATRAGKRFERSGSLGSSGYLGGSSSTNLLPSLTLTSIPERSRLVEGPPHQDPNSTLSRPKVLDLARGYPGRQSLDSSRFLRLPEAGVCCSPLLFPRRQQQALSLQSSPGDVGTSTKWNTASSSSSSSLLSPPQQDPKRFHSSLPRSAKHRPIGGAVTQKTHREPMASAGCPKSPGLDPVYDDKYARAFSYSASQINSQHADVYGTSQKKINRGQSSLPLHGSQGGGPARKSHNGVTSPCQPQQQQQQQQQSPLKSLYSLEEDGDLHASVLSLISTTSSSVFSTMTEERQAQEIKRLRHDLEAAHEKINSLTNQLNTNVYVVGAFEHSLTTMTNRLQKLTKTSELKDVELAKLKAALEEVERAKGQMSRTFTDQSPILSSELNRHKKSSTNDDDPGRNNAQSIPQALQSQQSCEEGKRKNMLWAKLGHTFKRAFSKRKEGSDSETEVTCSSEFVASGNVNPYKSPELPTRRHSNHHLSGYRSVPSTPLVAQRRLLDFFDSPSSKTNQKSTTSKAGAAAAGAAVVAPVAGAVKSEDEVKGDVEVEKVVAEMRQQLHDKEMELTDVRLEALSSAHMLEQLRETLNQVKTELNQERAENERLRQLLGERNPEIPASTVGAGNPTLGRRSINSNGDDQSKLLIREPPASYGNLTMDEMKKNVPKYVVAVKTRDVDGRIVAVGSVSLTSKTKWETLDSTVNRIFQEYLYKVDAGNTLSLSTKSIHCYRVGEVKRSKGDPLPELLPCGYLVGLNTTIVVSLNGLPALDQTSFETLLSKKSLERYAGLLRSYANLVMVGPLHGGKTHLARLLAQHLSKSSSAKIPINYLDVNSVSKAEFKSFITNPQQQPQTASSSSSTLKPKAILIVDNLTHSIIISQDFVDFLENCARNRHFLVGTMLTSQYKASREMLTAKIQVSVLDSQSEPLQGLLSRHLQRRVIEEEIKKDRKLDADLVGYLKYIVQVYDHLCSFIRDQCCQTADEIGPTPFFSAPLDRSQFQSWFVELWNSRLIPHLTSALSSHLKPTSSKSDPTVWVRENLPWPSKSLLSLTSSPPPDLLMTSPRSRKTRVVPKISGNDDDDDDDVDNYPSIDEEEEEDDDGRLGKTGKRLINADAYQLLSQPPPSHATSSSSSSSPPPLSLSSSSLSPTSISSSTSARLISKSSSFRSRLTTPMDMQINFPSQAADDNANRSRFDNIYNNSNNDNNVNNNSSSHGIGDNNYNDDHNRNRHHLQQYHRHHHFARSPLAVRKASDAAGKVKIDPLTNMLHRLQEAAMTASATPTATAVRRAGDDDDNGVYDNINNNNNNNGNNGNGDYSTSTTDASNSSGSRDSNSSSF